MELATHFIAALGLLFYTLWFALSLLIPVSKTVVSPALKFFVADIGRTGRTTYLTALLWRD